MSYCERKLTLSLPDIITSPLVLLLLLVCLLTLSRTAQSSLEIEPAPNTTISGSRGVEAPMNAVDFEDEENLRKRMPEEVEEEEKRKMHSPSAVLKIAAVADGRRQAEENLLLRSMSGASTSQRQRGVNEDNTRFQRRSFFEEDGDYAIVFIPEFCHAPDLLCVRSSMRNVFPIPMLLCSSHRKSRYTDCRLHNLSRKIPRCGVCAWCMCTHTCSLVLNVNLV